MRVTVLIFAQLADEIGTDRLDLELPDRATVRDALAVLGRDHPAIAAFQGRLAVAVDESYRPPETELPDGCTVALIPPVSGG
ncbi:MAG: molybdopterin converting factor subunit 1 [Planctomycetota bacterium]|jgi:molybdopterin converting factor subunit 1